MGGVLFFDFSVLFKLNLKKCGPTSILEAILEGFWLDLADFWASTWHQKKDQKNGRKKVTRLSAGVCSTRGGAP